MILKLIGGNNPKLLQKVAFSNNDKAVKIGREMLAFTVKHPARGLAANQFGIMERVCIAEIKGRLRIFVNPKIVKREGSQLSRAEGCLTWPSKNGDIWRSQRIEVFHDIPDAFGGWYGITSIHEDDEAITLEHEIDHLDGIRCIDKFIKGKYKFGGSQ